MRLTVVRHGETVENKQRITQGQSDGTLSRLGIKQSDQLALDLASYSFDVIISSDLGRCTILAKKIHSYHPNTPLKISSEIREINFADYQGKPYVNMADFPGAILTRKVPGGESWIDLAHRILTFLNETYASYKEDKVLLVTHGGPIQAIRAYLESQSLETLAEEPSIPQCSVRHLIMERPVSRADLGKGFSS